MQWREHSARARAGVLVAERGFESAGANSEKSIRISSRLPRFGFGTARAAL